jgi:hypothetical protein
LTEKERENEMQDAWERRHLLRAVRPDDLIVGRHYLLVRLEDETTMTLRDTLIGTVRVVTTTVPETLQHDEHRRAILLATVKMSPTLTYKWYCRMYRDWFTAFACGAGTTFPIRYRFYEFPLRRDDLRVAAEIIGVLVGSPAPHVKMYDPSLPSTQEGFLALK